MGQALYRKYRSKSLDEIVGQDHIITALRTALKKGALSHAYLFTGPRGTGKTSIARILAHEVNAVPYTDEQSHIDIIEIDAASNRGIDEIRDLREKVYIAPTTGKYKVYIIDEVHMLTTQAFNALLKTLEEPPEHVIFILATTEAHKLPATIISRTQRYTFRPADRSKLVAHLKAIAAKEKMQIADEALEVIADHGDGSYRDSVGLLDQVGSGGGKIGLNEVHELLGIPPAQSVTNLLQQLQANQAAEVAASLQLLQSQGYAPAAIAKEIAAQLRASLLGGEALLPTDQLFTLLKNLIDVPTATNAANYLEIILLEAMDLQLTQAMPAVQPSTQSTPQASVPEKPSKKAAEPVKSDSPKPLPQAPKPVAAAAQPVENPNTQTPSAPVNPGDLDASKWGDILAALKKQYNTLYSIIRMAQPDFEPHKLTLTFGFAFHQKRVNEAKNKSILARVITDITGEEVEISCLYSKDAKPAPVIAAAEPAAGGAIDTVSNIFGGGELLES